MHHTETDGTILRLKFPFFFNTMLSAVQAADIVLAVILTRAQLLYYKLSNNQRTPAR
jgi:hypothetical protein